MDRYTQYNYTPQAQPQQYVPKTAINELDSFMSGLTEEDRQTIFDTPEFAGTFSDYLNRFMFYLLQGDIGAEFVNSSRTRSEIAERLKLMAHNIYASNKKDTVSEIERLQKENESLLARLRTKEAKISKVSADDSK